MRLRFWNILKVSISWQRISSHSFIKLFCSPFTTGQVVTSLAYSGGNEDTCKAHLCCHMYKKQYIWYYFFIKVYDNTWVLFRFYSVHLFTCLFLTGRGWFVHGKNGAWNVVLCNVTVLDVSYTYSSSQYITNTAVSTSIETARYVVTAMFFSSSTLISDAVDGAGLQTKMPYEEAYSLELSRQTLARGAYIYAPSDVLSILRELNIIGTELQLIPLVIFVVAMLLFSCVGLTTYPFKNLTQTTSQTALSQNPSFHYFDLHNSVCFRNPLRAPRGNTPQRPRCDGARPLWAPRPD